MTVDPVGFHEKEVEYGAPARVLTLRRSAASDLSRPAPTDVPRVVPGDVDDDQVIAAAVAAQANLIVSGDRKHLLPLGSHAGIAIVDAAEALRLISTE